MPKVCTLTTPEDFINAFCGTQTCETPPTARARTYVPLFEDLLLCALGATPHAEEVSAYSEAHAGAARWLESGLQRATVPQTEGQKGGQCVEGETAPRQPVHDAAPFARCASSGP
ncbi:hypothetical protein T484DRAFT_1740347 [Baffinella frigidus]|nr:hypothetical protein T484DRAFT_1740347 [Cryptophyta sp. CCMP2293]